MKQRIIGITGVVGLSVATYFVHQYYSGMWFVPCVVIAFFILENTLKDNITDRLIQSAMIILLFAFEFIWDAPKWYWLVGLLIFTCAIILHSAKYMHPAEFAIQYINHAALIGVLVYSIRFNGYGKWINLAIYLSLFGIMSAYEQYQFMGVPLIANVGVAVFFFIHSEGFWYKCAFIFCALSLIGCFGTLISDQEDAEKYDKMENTYKDTPFFKATRYKFNFVMHGSEKEGTAEQRGVYAEFVTGCQLDKLPFYHKELFGVYIPNEDESKSSEIDIISINEHGVYCIEVKNWAGTIAMNPRDDSCLIEYENGEVKERFENPLKQNLTHIHRLSRFVDSYICGCLVYGPLTTKIALHDPNHENHQYVGSYEDLNDFIINHSGSLTKAEIDRIYKNLKYYEDNEYFGIHHRYRNNY